MSPAIFLEHIVILCFEWWYPKQNSVIIRLKTKILPPQNFGLATLVNMNGNRSCHFCYEEILFCRTQFTEKASMLPNTLHRALA